MNFDFVIKMLDNELFVRKQKLNGVFSPAQFSYYSKQVDELRAAILLLQQKANSEPQPQLQQTDVGRSCPHCGSNKVIMFTADEDMCQSCGKSFMGA